MPQSAWPVGEVRAGQPPPPENTPLQSVATGRIKESRTLRVGLIAGPEATWDLAAARVAEHLRRQQNLEVYYAWDCVEFGIDDPADYDASYCLVGQSHQAGNASNGSSFTAGAADR